MQEARPWGPLNLRLKNLDSIPQSWGATESWGGNRVTESAPCLTKITLAEEERTDQSQARLREMKVMAQAQGKKQQELVLGQQPRRWRKQERLESSLQG